MANNKYSYLFDPRKDSNKLSLIYFSNYDKVKKEDRTELRQAYFYASDIAEKREFAEADKGVCR